MDIADTKANNLYKTMHEQGMLKSDYHNTVGKLLRKLCKWNLNETKDRKELEDIIQEFKKYSREDNEFDGLYAGFFNAPVLTQLIAEHKA